MAANREAEARWRKELRDMVSQSEVEAANNRASSEGTEEAMKAAAKVERDFEKQQDKDEKKTAKDEE